MQHKNISMVSFSFTLMTVLFFLFSMPVFASCNHDWQLNYETCEDGTDGRHHVVSSHYTCENCGKQKTETTKSDEHSWEEVSVSHIPYSPSKHEVSTTFTCKYCHASKTVLSYESHDWLVEEQPEEDYSPTHHKCATVYSCPVCGEQKTVTKYEKHKWESQGRHDYSSISNSMHSYVESFYCSSCNAYEERQKQERHTFGKDNCCVDCSKSSPKNLNNTAGLNLKVSGLKVKAKKNRRIKVSWKANKTVDGYEIQYSLNKNFSKKGKTKKICLKTNERNSYTLKKLKSGKKYFVRVRAYKNISNKDGSTKKVYSKWTKKSVKTK